MREDYHRFMWAGADDHKRLRKRRKGWRLSHCDKLFLIKILTAFPDWDDEVCQLYRISKTTLGRVKRIMPSSAVAYELFISRETRRSARDQSIQSTFEELVKPPKFSLTLSMIGQNFNRKTGIGLSRRQLGIYIKNRLRYSYIKGSYRPLKTSNPNQIIFKGLFSIRFLRILLGNEITANYDESSFNRDIIRNYSWLPRGKGGEILNTTISNKTNLILSVFPSGSWICFIKDGNIASKDFWIFIILHSKKVKSKMQKAKSRVNLIIDNAKIHHTSIAKKIMKFSEFNPIFPSPYSSELLPVELCFKAVKEIIRSFSINEKLDYSSEEGARIIIRALGMVRAKYIQSCWIKAVRKLKESVAAAVETGRWIKVEEAEEEIIDS